MTAMDRSDTQCVAAFKGGDQQAYGELYDRYIERIYRFVYFKTFDKDIAEDIVSTVFLKAYERIGTFDATKGAFSQWIYGIARNAVIDHYRTAKQHVDIEDVFDLGLDERTEEKIDARDLLQKVEKYLTTLTPRQREIVTLRLWQELSYREIAEIVGGTEDAAKVMFSRTIRELREKLGPAALVALVMLMETGYQLDRLS
jgi:RNA polymerase sigma-70 factor, ECF subfamily